MISVNYSLSRRYCLVEIQLRIGNKSNSKILKLASSQCVICNPEYRQHFWIFAIGDVLKLVCVASLVIRHEPVSAALCNKPEHQEICNRYLTPLYLRAISI